MIVECLLDMDGVLVGFHEGMRKALGITKNLEQIYRGKEGTYCLAKTLGIPADELWLRDNREFWANLPWEDFGQEILATCEKAFGQDNVTLWTTPSGSEGCHAGKIDWMKKHLPPHYSTIHGHVFGSRKYLGANKHTILIDDKDENVNYFRKRGGECCLVPRIWNSSYFNRDRAGEYVVRRLANQKPL